MSASWPTTVATDATLYVAVNELQNNLSGAINNSVTTIGLNSTTGFPTVGLVLIDNEVIKYGGISGNNLTSCTRAFDGTTAASHSSGAVVSFAFCAQHHNGLKDEIIAVETSLNLTASKAIATNSSGRLVAASTTDTELGYLSGVTSAVQTQMNAKAADAAVVHNTGTETVAGVKTFSSLLKPAGGILGVTGNGDAAAGNVDEYIESFVTVAFPASTVIGDATSIALTAGDWDLTLNCLLSSNGGTITVIQTIGISQTAGNSSTGLVLGRNFIGSGNVPSATFNVPYVIANYRVKLSGPATLYAKMQAQYSATAPTFIGVLSARRRQPGT